MLTQRIPLLSQSSNELYLVVSIDFDRGKKHLPPADTDLVPPSALSFAERRVIAHIDLPAKSIAHKLNISLHTVKKHIQNMMRKTGCESNVELALWAMRNRILTD